MEYDKSQPAVVRGDPNSKLRDSYCCFKLDILLHYSKPMGKGRFVLTQTVNSFLKTIRVVLN